MTRNNHSRRRDVRDYMARHGVTYTQALRALMHSDAPSLAVVRLMPPKDLTAPTDPIVFRVRPVEQGGPRLPTVVTADHDVNPVCGHWLGNRCAGCATCTTCDGCYCEELRSEARLDAYFGRVARDHEQHLDEPGPDCPTCELDREQSMNFTECPKCHKPLQGFWHFVEHCPPYCYKDKPHPPGLDWSHLVGKRITIDTHWCYQGDMAKYAASWTGTVTGRWKNPDTGAETDLYELQLDPTVPQPNNNDLTPIEFDPRGFTITEH
ncbi:hypothetical protein [Nocardia amamiensis]|uniref:hypothetical protein n=1 Tax=Nocardia amamiensis TaxID=404578 RepID=UPI000AD6B95E|nr:hypothetical protein [Nocardia amamiensis]